jgi:hypothetical protein
MARRIFDPRQQGSRLSWDNDLFQLVERVQPPASQPLDQLPVPDVTYVTDEGVSDALRHDVSPVTLKSWHS